MTVPCPASLFEIINKLKCAFGRKEILTKMALNEASEEKKNPQSWDMFWEWMVLCGTKM